MEKEVQQLKINASNIRSILVRRSSDLKKIRSNRKNLERITKERQKRTLREKVIETSRQTASNNGTAGSVYRILIRRRLDAGDSITAMSYTSA